jgi:hypothetical protein
MQVSIKFLDKESIQNVLNFFNSAQSDKLQTNNRSLKEFEWLFINSFFKKSLYAVALDNESGEIIGTYAGIFIQMLSKNGERILTIKGEDTLISLDKMISLGKRDILKELLHTIVEKSRDDNSMFMWGFTPAKAAFKRCGFKIITQIKGSFYVIKPLIFYNNRIRLFPQLTLMKKIQLFVFSWVNYLNIKLKLNSSGEFFNKRISFEEVDEKVLLSFLPENVYTTYLSKDFLKWRIKENPSPVTYGFLEFRDKRNIVVAYFIFSSNKENIFFVEQFLFARQLTDNKKVQIMKHAFKYCRRQKAIMIRALGFTHNELNIKDMNLLSKSGFYFFNNPEESYFIFQNLSYSDIKPEDIYLSRLNTQGIR